MDFFKSCYPRNLGSKGEIFTPVSHYYGASQLNSMDHNFFENDSPEEELKEDMLVKLMNLSFF